ncbi:MAG: PilX N-terminal domain-containing pilus assembly protein [Rhodanobacter sp.]
MSSNHRSMRRLAGAHATQRGVVLVVALIFLLLLTIIAVAASSRSLLQERMAGGLLNAQRAQMSAQTALRGAEWRLWSSAANVGTTLGCGTSLFPACTVYEPVTPDADAESFRTKPGWDGVTSTPNAYVEYKGSKNDIDFTATTDGKLADNPRYIIEDMGLVRPLNSGPQHESGQTGPTGSGPGQVNLEMYRITARATGGDKNTVSVLQSTFDAQTQ